MALSILCSARLLETVITGQIMAYTVSPAGALFFVEVWKSFTDEVVDGTKGRPFWRYA